MKLLGLLTGMLSMCLVATTAYAQCTNCQTPGYSGYGYPGHCCHHGTACDMFVAGYCANATWPKYYVPPARCAVNSVYSIMVANGWRRQNLLGDYHFEKDSHELTKAGKLKAKWILTQAPPEQRMIYVERGNTQDTTASRIAAVQSWAANQDMISNPVTVNDTHIVSEGHPAGAVDNIFVGFQSNQPPPILPAPASSGTTTQSQ